MPDALTDDRRRELFAALVARQDSGQPVSASRQAVAGEFGVTTAEVVAVEREGLKAQWPPLEA